MSNSIFDDDDGAFSLSSGFDGGEAPKAPKVTPPKDRPAVGQPQTRINRPVTSPNKQQAPVRPGMPAKGGATSARRQEQKPTAPTSGLPKAPMGASPDTGRNTKLPTMPPLRSTGNTSLPSAPKASIQKSALPAVPVQEERYVDEEMPRAASRQYEAPEPEAPTHSPYAETAASNLREQDEEDYVDYEQERRDRERRREREIARQREEEQRVAQRQREDYERLMAEERRRKAEEEEANRNNNNSSNTESKNTKKKSRGKGKTAKPVKQSKYAGGRKQVLWLQIVVFTVLGVMVLAGAKSIFLPNAGPTPQQVISTVKKGIGMTDFPTARGEGFVIAFSDAYLTLNNGGVSERNKILSLYMPLSVVQEQAFQQSGPADQTVTGGPYINSVKSIDDNNAVYTVSAQVNNGVWIYMDVPAYYDSENDTFAISGSPAFTAAPEQATVPAQPRSWTSDDKAVVDVFTPNAEIFFDAWSKSDKKAMNPFLTEDANTTAKTGLNGTAKFSRLAAVHVEPAPETADVSKGEIRQARVTVVWENPYVATTTYQQTYDLTLKKVADQWRIQAIDGGVPTEVGNDQK